MKIDLKEYIIGRDGLFTATNVVEMEECLTEFLVWYEKTTNDLKQLKWDLVKQRKKN